MPPRRTDQEKLDEVLSKITSVGWSIGDFLRVLFTDFRAKSNRSSTDTVAADAEANELGGNIEASRMSVQDSASKKMLGRQSTLLTQFLRQTPEDSPSSVSSIMSMIYKHRASSSGTAKPDDDPKTMARHFMLRWAPPTVAESAELEIKRLVGCPELRLPTAQMDWTTL
ncbi:hypothetical protein FRC11_012556, partial [Ceratobasidium sp. 423]